MNQWCYKIVSFSLSCSCQVLLTNSDTRPILRTLTPGLMLRNSTQTMDFGNAEWHCCIAQNFTASVDQGKKQLPEVPRRAARTSCDQCGIALAAPGVAWLALLQNRKLERAPRVVARWPGTRRVPARPDRAVLLPKERTLTGFFGRVWARILRNAVNNRRCSQVF